MFATMLPGYVQLDAEMRNVTRYEGETVRIRCEITGFPLPGYRWFRDDTNVEQLDIEAARRYSVKTTPWGSRFATVSRQPLTDLDYLVSRSPHGL